MRLRRRILAVVPRCSKFIQSMDHRLECSRLSHLLAVAAQ